MKTIVESKEHIDKLWGKQRIRENETYRMMRYVLRADYDGEVLLHNVVTGRLVILEHSEAEVVDKLPLKYKPVMEELVEGHYLVPERYDEHQQVVNLRQILWKLEDSQSTAGIVSFTILPTTACNARCYYCFEHGCKSATMTEQTANDVVDYIVKNCGEDRKVFITWFGGEPTIASRRIDQISGELLENGINYSSCMITNGYLFDEEMVKRAKDLWHVQYLQICVDGTETTSNKAKAFIGVKDSPYERVMQNIGFLLSNEIAVILRMNFDLNNYNEFKDLCKEVAKRFKGNQLLSVAAHPIIGEYQDHDGKKNHGSDEWFTEEMVELTNISRIMGLSRNGRPLPNMNIRMCGACREDSVVITPEGGIAKCPEKFTDNQLVGNVLTGVVHHELVQEWKAVADYRMCTDCKLFPCCVRLANCSNKTYCHNWKSYQLQYAKQMVRCYNAYLKGEKGNDFSGTKDGVCFD